MMASLPNMKGLRVEKATASLLGISPSLSLSSLLCLHLLPIDFKWHGNYDFSLMSRKCPSCLYLLIEPLLQHGIVLEARSLLGIGQHLVLLKECPVLEKSFSSTELTTRSAVSCFHNDSIDSSYLIFMPILLGEPGLWYICDYSDRYLSCFTVISVIMALSARRPSAGALDPLEQPLHALSQMLAAYARHFVREIHRASTGKYCRFWKSCRLSCLVQPKHARTKEST